MSAPKLKAFYETGKLEFDLFKSVCDKNDLELPANISCFELGCGVGRVTHYLAKEFAKVIAVDISPGNMKECQKKIEENELKNVEMVLLTTPTDIEKVKGFNVFFSRIVLQHNPPPVQSYLLSTVLENLESGGIAFFQAVTGGPGYRYSASSHLVSHSNDFEMHALPMKFIFAAIYESGCQLVDMFRDLSGGFNVASYSFLVRKSGV